MSASVVTIAHHRARRALAAALLASTALAGTPASAQDATWLATPGSGVMTDGLNWSSGALPTGTATFGASSITSLTLGASSNFGGWTFASDAPAYAITTGPGLHRFTGAGIVVNGAIPTLTNTGTIQFSNASSLGSAAVINNGALQFNDTSSAGAATITNNRSITLYVNSTLGAATITGGNQSFLAFFENSSAASSTITTTGSTAFFQSSTAGSSTITSSSSITFQQDSNAGSAVINTNNRLQFDGNSHAGSATINNTLFLNFLAFSSANTATINNTSGSLRFSEVSTAGLSLITNNAGAFMSFEGSSTAASATITNRGTLGFYSNATAASATIANNGTLLFYGPATAGSAAITSSGEIHFQFDATAGSATIANSGSLFVRDSSSTGTATITSSGLFSLQTTDTTGAAAVTIQSGGSLTGFGGVGNTTIQSGGLFAPVIGTLTVNGNLTLNAGSTYAFSPTGLAAVSGLATLGGARLQFDVRSFQAQTYTVLTAAGGVAGTFTFDPALASVLYGANDVTITVNGYRAASALAGSGTTNTRNVAAALDRVIDASGGAPPAAFNPLLNLNGSSLATALNSLSGEAATGAQSTAFSTASTFLGIMLDPMAGARGATASAPGSSLIEMADTGMTPAARVSAGWSVWTKAFGQAGRSASDAGTGAAGTASSVFGVAAGADRRISPDTLVGFALAGGGTVFGLGGRGSGTGDYMQLGLYGSTRLGEGYLSSAIAYGWNRYDVTRRAGLGPIETYTSSPVAHTFGGRVEAGRRFGSRALAVTPYAAVEAIGYASGAYRENWVAPATGAFALAYAARTTGTVRTEAGLRIDGMRAVAPTADLLTFGRIAYAWQAGTARSADASFQQLANSGFTVFGARASTHTMLATLGTEIRLATGTRATASLDGELGDRHRSIRANVGLSHSW